jgi:hypothetical protein
MWFDDALRSARLLPAALALFAAFVPSAAGVLTGSMVPLYQF